MEIRPIDHIEELKDFCCGIQVMDNFIHSGIANSVENHYCIPYALYDDKTILAFFALSFDSLELDSDDKEELQTGISSAGTPNVTFDYQATFFAKPRYPSMDIAYLAVSKDCRGKGIGSTIMDYIIELARNQTLAGCQFLTVEALAIAEYSAVGFYYSCGFAPAEVKKPYKDTIRMFYTLYAKHPKNSKED